MSIFTRTALAAALMVAAPFASAATASDPMTVSITIVNSCTIDATDLDFGTPNTLANDIDADTSVAVECTGAGPLSIEFSTGAGTGATFASRKMTGPAATTIDYSLYLDAARTQALGDGTSSSVVIAGTSTGGVDVFPVYGRVLGAQNPKPVGSYSDVVTATVTF